MTVGVEIENRSCDPYHAPFKGGLSRKRWDLILSTFVLNLTTLAV